MPIRWNVPEHSAALQQIIAALDDDGARAGAVVLGPDGCGKSTLARLAAEDYAQRHPGTRVRWVIGTPTERGVPLGAFSHLVEVSEIGKPAALLRAARASLADGKGELVLVIDDAHQLDLLSATLVYQLALTGSARMIVTGRADGSPAAPITALWSDNLLPRIDIPAGDADTAGQDIDAFVAGLPAGARAVLDYLAVCEPLALVDLENLTSADAVRQAEELGAVETRVRGGHGCDPVVYTAHPLFARRALAALGDAGARARRTQVVGVLTTSPCRLVGEQLRLAALAADSDTPQTAAQMVDAAEQAMRLGDPRLGEKLARVALEHSGGLPARLALAHALGWQGRGRDADEVLAAVDPATLNEPDLMAWALPRAANQFFMLGEPERATAFLAATRGRVSGPRPRDTLDALGATFAMNAGNIGRAVELATTVLADPAADDMAVAWAGSAAALCAARAGRFDDVGPLAARALGAEHPGVLRFTVGLAEITTLLMAERLAEARELAWQFTDFAELTQPGRAVGEVLVAVVLIAAEEFADAAALLAPAAATLDRTGYSWGPLSLTLLATALARQSDIAGAAKALRRAESRHGTKSALFAPELGMARAWQRAGMRDQHGAIAAAREGARMAQRSGQSAVALQAWDVAARLGDAQAGDPLARLCGEVDCAFGRGALERVRR
ncbi:AAA family ATPase [Mycolicibacter hiberniae]|uniref:ATPase AAA n=1 Tax=Mycolicibacter hiberniae TaxID=29314 RepID=A0A7I7WXG9_9MYCO|nr:AAA family ATPase [Mycolicibacter hiberniae]MCV7086689.1 AAA family ATPase [Mycolicibacter hiberniae]ORV67029.1 AAA family ATPase [Mycolicibacter hiberniae]BBZ22276.1 ATPase AAA [Mycolicibacter hiberniae]